MRALFFCRCTIGEQKKEAKGDTGQGKGYDAVFVQLARPLNDVPYYIPVG